MSDFPLQSQVLPAGLNGGNRFFAKAVLPAMSSSDTASVTVPDGCPKDAIPVGPPGIYALSSDTWTRDNDINVVTSHNRSTGVTVYTAGGNVAAGTVLIQEYVGLG